MNRPIRTLAVFCPRPVRPAAAQRQLRAGLQGRRPQRDGGQQAGPRRRVLERARPHPGRRQDRGQEPRVRRPAQVHPPLRRGPSSTRRSPATSPATSAPGPSRRPRTRSCPAATAGCSSTGCSTWSATTSRRAAASSPPSTPSAQKAAYRGLLDLPGDARGAVVALDPSTGAILADVSIPSYNPNVLAGHDFDAGEGRVRQRSTPARRAELHQPVDPVDLPAGLDVQAGHRGHRAVQRLHPGHAWCGAAPRSTCPRRRTCCTTRTAPTAAATRSP